MNKFQGATLVSGALVEHLPGKHDQKSHGYHGQAGMSLQKFRRSGEGQQASKFQLRRDTKMWFVKTNAGYDGAGKTKAAALRRAQWRAWTALYRRGIPVKGR